MHPFTYHCAKSVREASEQLRQFPDAKFLAGGMTLLSTMKQGFAKPSHLIDLTRIPELYATTHSNTCIQLGAAICHADVAASELVRGTIGALGNLALNIGDAQVRNRGTLGGSVANNDPAADYSAAVLALGATVVNDRRRLRADDFFQGMFTTALEADEVIISIEFPIPRAATYASFRHPVSGYAMAGAFVAKFDDAVRVAVTGAAPCAFRWREAEQCLSKRFSLAAVAAVAPPEEATLDDLHAAAEYRAHLATEMLKRAVAQLAST